MTDSLKGLGVRSTKMVYKLTFLFLTILLQLSCSKYHICCSPALMEFTLTLWQQVLVEVLIQMVQQDPGQDIPCYGYQGDASMIITSQTVSLSFVEVNSKSIFRFLWDFSLVPHGMVHLGELPNLVLDYQLHTILLGWSQNLELCHWKSS